MKDIANGGVFLSSESEMSALSEETPAGFPLLEIISVQVCSHLGHDM